jgi:DNA-binding GntR family transcriptional regulator
MNAIPNPSRRRRHASAQGFKLADAVHESLRADILARRYEPGERLDIPGLARRFQTSQMPVRQAIGRLADAGLVDVKPRSGSYVTRLDFKEISDTFDVRCALEKLAAESAVLNVTEADLQRLERLVNGIDAAVGAGDAEAHDELNSEFHDSLLRLSGNNKLVQIYEDLNAHIKIARIHLETRDWAQRTELEHAEHRAILSALQARSAERLGAALSQHIERSKQVLLADLRKTL